MAEHAARNLEELLTQIAAAAHSDRPRVTVGDILEAVGTRSFAPLLMLTGALLASPLSGIPLFSTTMGLIVTLVSVQMLVGRRHFWLPRWLLTRRLQRASLLRALDWLQPPFAFIDRYLKPRLDALVRGPAQIVIALVCLSAAVMMPILELVPFSSSLVGVMFCAFGLALVAHDGLMALLAYAMIALVVAVVAGAV